MFYVGTYDQFKNLTVNEYNLKLGLYDKITGLCKHNYNKNVFFFSKKRLKYPKISVSLE